MYVMKRVKTTLEEFVQKGKIVKVRPVQEYEKVQGRIRENKVFSRTISGCQSHPLSLYFQDFAIFPIFFQNYENKVESLILSGSFI